MIVLSDSTINVSAKTVARTEPIATLSLCPYISPFQLRKTSFLQSFNRSFISLLVIVYRKPANTHIIYIEVHSHLQLVNGVHLRLWF